MNPIFHFSPSLPHQMRLEFCRTLFKILDRFDSSLIKVFALQLKCQRNIVVKIPFLVRFLPWNYLRNWRNFFDNFLWKGIFAITSISCTAPGKFPLAAVWVREHLSQKSWLVLNWPLSQPCAKNNHRRSVFVSNLVFFYREEKALNMMMKSWFSVLSKRIKQKSAEAKMQMGGRVAI